MHDRLMEELEKKILKEAKRKQKNRQSIILEVGAFTDGLSGEKYLYADKRLSLTPILEYTFKSDFTEFGERRLSDLVEQKNFITEPVLMMKNINEDKLIKLLKKYEGIGKRRAKEIIKKLLA